LTVGETEKQKKKRTNKIGKGKEGEEGRKKEDIRKR